LITLDQVTLTYADGDRRLTAVDDVSLTVRPGTLTALTGPSGSGKSSLLAIASTLVRPEAGRVLVGDVDTTTLTVRQATALRRERVGIVFQQSNLLPSLTATDQLVVMGELGGPRRATRRARAARARELLDEVGLAAERDKRPDQLSGGQRQRVNIARSLMNDPSVLLVDEPTSALDQERGAEIIDLVVGLTADRGTATLLVTHDLGHLPRMHAVVGMLDGRLAPVPA
jgi:putative ABC transport system ATP-binding protein